MDFIYTAESELGWYQMETLWNIPQYALSNTLKSQMESEIN